jgi:hypothetical protein
MTTDALTSGDELRHSSLLEEYFLKFRLWGG